MSIFQRIAKAVLRCTHFGECRLRQESCNWGAAADCGVAREWGSRMEAHLK